MVRKEFGQIELENFLSEIDFKISKALILKYVQTGHVLGPKRKEAFGSRTASRIYYHPLSAIEVMVTSMLFQGDWLKQNSIKRIIRLTMEDIFFARLQFYHDIAQNPVKEIHDYKYLVYGTNIQFSVDNVSCSVPILVKDIHYIMDKVYYDSVYDYLPDCLENSIRGRFGSKGKFNIKNATEDEKKMLAVKYLKQKYDEYLDAFNQTHEDRELGKLYRECTVKLYRRTYLELCRKYLDELSYSYL